jgi:hypothetical protein
MGVRARPLIEVVLVALAASALVLGSQAIAAAATLPNVGTLTEITESTAGTVAGATETVTESVVDSTQAGTESVVGTASDTTQTVIDGVTDTTGTTTDAVDDAVTNVTDTTRTVIEDVTDTTRTTTAAVDDAVTSVTDGDAPAASKGSPSPAAASSDADGWDAKSDPTAERGSGTVRLRSDGIDAARELAASSAVAGRLGPGTSQAPPVSQTACGENLHRGGGSFDAPCSMPDPSGTSVLGLVLSLTGMAVLLLGAIALALAGLGGGLLVAERTLGRARPAA